MFNNRCYDRDDINNNFYAENMDVDMNMDYMNNNMNMDPGMIASGQVAQPIIEPMQERIVNRTIVHEVPHICPLQTKIVNHHVFKHASGVEPATHRWHHTAAHRGHTRHSSSNRKHCGREASHRISISLVNGFLLL